MSVVELAEAAAEAIRAANHATFTPGALAAPEVYRVVGELASLSHRLEQLTTQLGKTLEARLELGGLRLDATSTHEDPSDAIASARQHLSRAALSSASTGSALDRCLNVVACIADEGSTDD